ncbi:hypothetical protein [Kribbella sp. CA-293567]|uniref:hypothetical protein n=1 Tax=Kribbella sp. CA-293567 TaxID=3002436 RepID=UPI0022DD66F5|nr:hypothetical protein [Kribbella sp. CA-293567]WBQ02208.1 hypothetical protein OX958_19685 [Kribbella sp. CA-293567]
MRYLWSVPAAVAAWFVAGFAPSYLTGLPAGSTTFVGTRLDLLVLGGFTGGVLAGLIVARLRYAVPLVLIVAVGSWWLSGYDLSAQGLLMSLLVASVVGAGLGALGTRNTVLAAFALSVPVAWFALRPADELQDWLWLWQLNGLLVAIGLTTLLYAACWRRGWPSAYSWLPLSVFYVASFAMVDGIQAVAAAKGQSIDVVADAGTDAFFAAFEPLLREYWPWLLLAVLLAIPMVALKVRALPPPPLAPGADDGRSNDAVLSDDLDWIDREEPKRRLLPARR